MHTHNPSIREQILTHCLTYIEQAIEYDEGSLSAIWGGSSQIIDAKGAAVSCPEDAPPRLRKCFDLVECGYTELDTVVRLHAPIAGLDLDDPLDEIILVDILDVATEGDAIIAFAAAAGCFGGYAPKHLANLVELEGRHEVDPLEDLVELAHARASQEHDEVSGGPFNGPADLRVGGCADYQTIVYGTSRSVAALLVDLNDDGSVLGYRVAIGFYADAAAQRGAHWSLLDSCNKRREARDASLSPKGGDQG